MKVGSIVENVIGHSPTLIQRMLGAKPCPKGGPYTIRGIHDTEYGTILTLEEIINVKAPCGIEFGYPMRDFREIVPPSIEEQIKGMLAEPILIEA